MKKVQIFDCEANELLVEYNADEVMYILYFNREDLILSGRATEQDLKANDLNEAEMFMVIVFSTLDDSGEPETATFDITNGRLSMSFA